MSMYPPLSEVIIPRIRSADLDLPTQYLTLHIREAQDAVTKIHQARQTRESLAKWLYQRQARNSARWARIWLAKYREISNGS